MSAASGISIKVGRLKLCSGRAISHYSCGALLSRLSEIDRIRTSKEKTCKMKP